MTPFWAHRRKREEGLLHLTLYFNQTAPQEKYKLPDHLRRPRAHPFVGGRVCPTPTPTLPPGGGGLGWGWASLLRVSLLPGRRRLRGRGLRLRRGGRGR